MAALKSVGEQDENGQWFVSGQKIFITSGHGKYHFVIARTEKAEAGDNPMAGLAGLSMFLVNTYEDLPDGTRKRYVTIDRVEEKLGHHGSVTAALSFDRAPAQLIGKRGEGFKYMLVLMNNARLGVGFESIGLCESAYRMAKAYAEERRSMGKSVAQHEMIADYLDEMNTDVRALRALAVKGAYHEEMSQKIGIFTKVLGGDKTKLGRFAESLPYHREEARRLTPLLKYLASEKAVEMARRCIQIHGGVGYTKDYGAEKLLRDALVLPIYEGTSQIQSLMVMKDALGSIIKKPKAFVARLAQVRLRSISSRDPLLRRAATIELHALLAQQHLVVKTAAGKIKGLSGVPLAQWPETMRTGWDPKRDFSWAMLHAERLTRLMADAAVVTILAEQAAEHPERRELLVAYVERAELRSKALYEEILRTGGRLLDSLQGATVSENVPHAAQ
jgi:alkylation response protein AidB-like acyl-CoA dehydrogenase